MESTGFADYLEMRDRFSREMGTPSVAEVVATRPVEAQAPQGGGLGQLATTLGGKAVKDALIGKEAATTKTPAGGAFSLAGAVPVAGATIGALLLGKGIKDFATGKPTTGAEGLGGRATLGITTGGVSEIARLAGLGGFAGKDRWAEEQGRVADLAKRGVAGWDLLQKGSAPLTRGRTIDELVALEEAKKAAGKYSNADFARTRDVKYLKPEDIWGYSAFGEKYGDDWLGRFSEQQRRNVAQAYLDAGNVTEGRDQIGLKSTPAADALVASILSGAASAPQVVAVGGPGKPVASNRFAQSIKKEDLEKQLGK